MINFVLIYTCPKAFPCSIMLEKVPLNLFLVTLAARTPAFWQRLIASKTLAVFVRLYSPDLLYALAVPSSFKRSKTLEQASLISVP